MSLVVEVDANRLADGKSGSHRAPACVESACVRGQHERLAHVRLVFFSGEFLGVNVVIFDEKRGGLWHGDRHTLLLLCTFNSQTGVGLGPYKQEK